MNHFHPVVARWFAETFGEPTPAQRQGWQAIGSGRHTLIAAPTGSGKTLAAFPDGARRSLPRRAARAAARRSARGLRVAAQGAQHRHSQESRGAAPRHRARTPSAMGIDPPRITAAVRTGDTTQAERAAMLRTPPHILVTTPESLFLLLTGERSRAMLRTVRTVIVDEIHAVIGTRRGAHLALSLERLAGGGGGAAPAHRPVGDAGAGRNRRRVPGRSPACGDGRRTRDCAIVDEGHRRALDLAIELPGLVARSGDVERDLGGVLRPARRASCGNIARRSCS